MSSFLGSEVVAVDAKGRLVVPAKMRRGVAPEAADSFTLVRGPEGCVKMYPLDEWRTYLDHVRTYSSGDHESRLFMRQLFESAHETTVDGQGRISVSPRLLELAGVTAQAKLVGMGDHIELWSAERFDKSLAPTEGKYDERFDRMSCDIQAKRNGSR
jgi:MraZ protein